MAGTDLEVRKEGGGEGGEGGEGVGEGGREVGCDSSRGYILIADSFQLQNCDLLGSDLQHANLRGANIEGTNLKDVVI